MSNPITARRALAATASVGALLAMTACSSGGTTTTTTGSGSTTSASADCAAYTQYGDLKGKTVTVYTSISSDAEANPQKDSYKPFEQCTGATIKYEGSSDFESQLPVRIKAGNAPDIAYIPQPGLLNTLAKQNPGKIVEVGSAAAANVDKYYAKEWKSYGTVDGKFLATPLGANVKSFVWYSPKVFKEKGYTIPKTWDELITLSNKIAADYPNAKAWCAGFESGTATGWPGTDWIEDMMLRSNTPEDYDNWVAGKLKFADPKVQAAFAMAAEILKNDKLIDVKSIATTNFKDGGLGILDGSCFLHRQASFYQANWSAAKKDVKVAEDGDVFAFYLPGKTADVKPVLGGGEFVTAFRNAPEVQAFQAYLTSPEWSNNKAKATPEGGWLSANTGLDVNNLTSPVDKLSAQLLTDKAAVFRFDGSDMMPSAVGAGTFWKGMTDWVSIDKSSAQVAAEIDASWPKS